MVLRSDRGPAFVSAVVAEVNKLLEKDGKGCHKLYCFKKLTYIYMISRPLVTDGLEARDDVKSRR